jgi:hypothetical protein
MPGVEDREERRRLLESEIARGLAKRFAALREEFERLRRESDGLWAGFVSRLDPGVSGIVPAELLEQVAGTTPAPARPPIEAARELDGAPTQLEILRRLLDLTRRHASRAALLVLRGDAFSVWKAVGLPGGAEAESVVRRASLPAAAGTLSRVSKGTPCRLSSGNDVSGRLSCGDAISAVLVPIAIGEKVSGALYADAAPADADRFDADSVALLAFLAGLAIERVNARRFRPSPALAEFEYVFAAGEAADDYDTQVASIWKEAPPPEEVSSPAAVSEEPAAPSPEPGRRLSGPLAPKDEEEQRAEARRFARLLVSEIKLYNERAVEEGRAEGNLYRRLKQEIDLSRQIYEQRIPESIRTENDFLHEELVRILADGRPEALGI